MEAIGNWYIFNFLPHGFVWNETYMYMQQRLSSKPHFGLFEMLEVYDLERNTYFLGGVGGWLLLCAVYVSKSPCQGSHWTSAALCPVNDAVPLPRTQNPSSAEGSAQHYGRGSGAGVCVCLHMGWAGGKSAGLNWAVTHSQDVNCKSALFFLLWPYKCAYWNYLLERHTSLYAHMNLASYGM